MCTGHCCINTIFHPLLGSVCERSSSFPTWVIFLSSRHPVACPRCWVKVDKTPKYSVKHGRPLPCGRSLQCLLGNYGNNSAVRGEARGPGMMRSELRARDERQSSGRGRREGRGSRWSGRALASLSHKPSLSHQRPLDVCGHSLWSVLPNNQDADEGWWQVFKQRGYLCDLDWQTSPGCVVHKKVKMCLCLDCRNHQT